MEKITAASKGSASLINKINSAFSESTLGMNTKRLLGNKPKTKKGMAVKITTRIAYTAVLCALATLFNVITFYPVKYFALSFTVIPCFLAGVILGPFSGFLVGFMGDLLGWIIMPQGAYLPLVGIASGLWGFIPGVIFLLINGKDYFKLILSFFVCLIFCTAFLNTFNLWIVYSNGKSTFWAYLWLRIPFQFAVASINCFLSAILYKELSKAKIIKTAFAHHKQQTKAI